MEKYFSMAESKRVGTNERAHGIISPRVFLWMDVVGVKRIKTSLMKGRAHL